MCLASTRFPVFHVPHDGTCFPEELMESVCIPMEEFMSYHNRMRDVSVREMIPICYRKKHQAGCFEISRLLCDVERFIGPEEIMERYGMGFCYERAYDSKVIKTVTSDLREKTLVYYNRHHAKMDRICAHHKCILLFDLHSYANEIVPQDFLLEGMKTPDVCLGTDSRYTPEKLTAYAERFIIEAGFSVMRNYPYSGCYIPNSVMTGRSNCDLVSVMLEFNKRTYCDDCGIPDYGRIGRIRNLIKALVTGCINQEYGGTGYE